MVAHSSLVGLCYVYIAKRMVAHSSLVCATCTMYVAHQINFTTISHTLVTFNKHHLMPVNISTICLICLPIDTIVD